MRRHSALFTSSVALVTAVIAMAGCNPHVLASVELEINAEDEEVLQLEVNKDVDVLFVIDNSGTMAQEQVTLSENFSEFIKVLEADGVEANYRIGVTTSDNGGALCFQDNSQTDPTDTGSVSLGGKIRVSSCTTREPEFRWPKQNPSDIRYVDVYDEACTAFCDPSIGDNLTVAPTKSAKDTEEKVRPWIESIEGQTNLLLNGEPFTDMVQAFQCLGPQGVDGCGFESQLESQFKALSRANTTSEDQYGFLRDQAILAVVQVTDEADCSKNSEVASLVFNQNADTPWFQTDPVLKTSGICWNAGTKCTGDGSPYDNCTSQSYNYLGDEVSETYDKNNPDEEQQVLFPLQRYVDQIQEIESSKANLNGPDQAIVSVIGGVPEGYATGNATLVYQEATPGTETYRNFGIDFGCSSTVEGEVQDAVPPVRLREFAEAFNRGPVETVGAVYLNNLFSICAADYSPALEAVAQAIADQIRPGCFEACVQDIDPAEDGLQVQCKLTQEVPSSAAGSATVQDIPNCALSPIPNSTGACYEVITGADLDPTCADQGYNLEFKLVRDPDFPVPGGTSVQANCQLSDRPQDDCPNL